jgi:hypothetical protein
MGPSWTWWYDSWIYNYLCNQCPSTLKLWIWTLVWFGLWRLIPLSTIFQLYSGRQFLVEEARVPGVNFSTDHGQATGELYHMRLRVECTLFCNVQRLKSWKCETYLKWGAWVVQWVRSLDLTTHTSLSPIRRGFKPAFVHYKTGCQVWSKQNKRCGLYSVHKNVTERLTDGQ